MNSLLQWGIENSEASRNTTSGAAASTANANGAPASGTPIRGLNAEAINALLGGPSDADLMREAMTVIRSPSVSISNKLVAFDNFEQLVEQIDNANNVASLGLWNPLVEQLDSPDADLRRMAAWCVGTTVQNNSKAQERLLAVGGIPKLVRLAVEDEDPTVRRKCVYALSSEMRNYQPGTDEAVKHLPKSTVEGISVAAGDMDAIDAIMAKLRG